MTKKTKSKTAKTGRPTAYDRQQHLKICNILGISHEPKYQEMPTSDYLELRFKDLDALIEENDALAERLEATNAKALKTWLGYEQQIKALKDMLSSALNGRNQAEQRGVDLALQLAGKV